MRGETLAYPFSTYSVGERRSSVRDYFPDRNHTIPALAVIATISAVAITFGSAQVEERLSAPFGQPRAPHQNKGSSGQVSEGAALGLHWTLDDLQLPAANLSRQVPTSLAKQPIPAWPRETVGLHRKPRAPGEQSPSYRNNDPNGADDPPLLTHQADNAAAALADCSGACSAAGTAITDPGQSSFGVHEVIANTAPSADAAKVLEDSSASQLIAPERKPLLADYDQGRIVESGVGSSALRAGGTGLDPAIKKPIDDIDVRPGDLADATKNAQPFAELNSGARPAASLKPPPAIGLETPKAGGPSTALSTHLARVKERYDDTAHQALGGPDAKGPETAPDALVGPSLSGAPLAQKLGSTIIVQDNDLVAIKLSELISLFESRLDRPLFVWMSTASAASKFVTTDTLASAGIKAHYDSGSRRLVLSLSAE